MKKILKQSHILSSYSASCIATSAAFAGVLTAMFLFAGISVAHADTTYVVDTTSPNGTCGTVCQQLQAYLGGSTSNVNNGTTNGSSNNGNPYFSTTGNNGTGNGTGYNTGSNSGSNSNGSNYTPSPYMIYNYYQNPNPSAANSSYGASQNSSYGSNSGSSGYGAYSPYSSSAYPTPIYVAYPPRTASTTASSYAQPAYGSGSNYSAPTGTGFIRTSGY